jgi:hypothetical protein
MTGKNEPGKPTGAQHLRASLAALRPPRSKTRAEMPKPTDPWAAWAEYRLCQLEESQRWLLRVVVGALVAQFALEVLKLI